MTALNATSKPSSSGARITGDDLQHLVVWYWCLRAIADSDGITSVAVEADHAGNVDDVVVCFADGKSNFIQVKAAVASANLASTDWLTDRPKRSGSSSQSPSLLQKLRQSWVDLGRPVTGLELITGRPIDGSDRVLALIDRRNSIGTGLRRARTQELTAARRDLADHLECAEVELCDFFDALAIRVGQTEAEWVSRVADVAASADIRADDSAVGVALAWVRTWVKDTRDPRTPEQIAAAAESMGLRIENRRTVIVIQGLRPEPVSDASHVLDWTERFRGTEASNRRGMVNPADWNGALSDDLATLRATLIEQQQMRVLVRERSVCRAGSRWARHSEALQASNSPWSTEMRCGSHTSTAQRLAQSTCLLTNSVVTVRLSSSEQSRQIRPMTSGARCCRQIMGGS